MVARIAVIALFLTSVCSAQQQPTADVEDAMVHRSLHLEYSDEWLAERDGVRITLFDIIGRLQDIPQDKRAPVLSSPERIASILNDLLLTFGMAEKAIERDLLDDPEVRAEIFYRAMVVLAQREQQAVLAAEELDDYSLQAREYYLANLDEFRNLEELDFTHVLFRANRSQKPVARQLAGQLLDALETPEALDSIDLTAFQVNDIKPTRARLDKITPNRLDARFAAGLARLQPGEVALIESGFGIHVVRLDARTQGGSRSFEDVREQLEARARQRHRDQILRRRMEAFYDAPLQLAEGAVERIIESQTAGADD